MCVAYEMEGIPHCNHHCRGKYQADPGVSREAPLLGQVYLLRALWGVLDTQGRWRQGEITESSRRDSSVALARNWIEKALHLEQGLQSETLGSAREAPRSCKCLGSVPWWLNPGPKTRMGLSSNLLGGPLPLGMYICLIL